MFQAFFYSKTTQTEIGHSNDTPRALQGHMDTRALGHSKDTWALGLSKHLDNWALEALERHLGTRTLKELEHLGTQALGHSKGTWALMHSGSWVLEALYLADSLCGLPYCTCALYISQRKIIKTKLITQSKAKSLFQR